MLPVLTTLLLALTPPSLGNLVGTWQFGGDWRGTITFASDGTYTRPDGDNRGRVFAGTYTADNATTLILCETVTYPDHAVAKAHYRIVFTGCLGAVNGGRARGGKYPDVTMTRVAP